METLLNFKHSLFNELFNLATKFIFQYETLYIFIIRFGNNSKLLNSISCYLNYSQDIFLK